MLRATPIRARSRSPSQLRIGRVLHLPHETLNLSDEERQHLDLEAGVALRPSVKLSGVEEQERRCVGISVDSPLDLRFGS